MNRNLIWKAVLIVVLVAVAALNLYPPKDKLKLGIDLAGGTSLIYEIDTTGMNRQEVSGLAQKMIPILLKRIDPTNVANIIIRPQGDTRIEIQLPLTTADTLAKRKAFEQAIEELDSTNVNLLKIKQALSYDREKRQEAFASFAGSSQERKTILEALADAYNQRREKQQQRDSLFEQKEQFKKTLEPDGINGDILEARAPAWAKLEENKRNESIDTFIRQSKSAVPPAQEDKTPLTEEQQKTKKLINEFLSIYAKWAETVNDLADPENGRDILWERALTTLGGLNLSIENLTEVLDMPAKSAQRQKLLDEFRTRFPDKADKIDAIIAAYTNYSSVGGRLDDPEDLKRMLKGAGVLEFRILPTTEDGTSNPGELQGYLEALQTKGPKLAGSNTFVWAKIENIKEFPRTYQQLGQPVIGTFAEKFYVLTSNQKNECMLHGTGKEWKLNRAYPTSDDMGRRVVGFSFDPMASSLFYNLTRTNTGRPLCILLDGIAISAPVIDEPIRSSGIIRGNFSQTQVEDMVNKFNAGSFPARLSEVPISEKSIGATIGVDNRNKGITAGLIGIAAVALFMFVYYTLGGAIADAALFLNLLFILAMMAMFRATFTLPGIAGLILTIGMSVDANVLIFERIREEQQRGSSLRTAIANGYQRAFRTIFDSNITTFITALILYMVASEEIKGFAIVLMLGIISSMFTALFATRLIFDFLVGKKIIRDHLVMLRLIKSASVNWMGMRPLYITLSGILIISGLTIFFTRNDSVNSKYDIEFTGGTSVQIDLKEGTGYDRQKVETEIQKIGEKYGSDAIKSAKVYSIGETGRSFEITTTATNKTSVTAAFAQSGGNTAESVKKTVEQAMDESGKSLYNLSVSGSDGQHFVITTSTVNKGIIEDILKRAFADKAVISEPEVDEIVSKAVREAFEGLLAVRENLGVEIKSVGEVSDADIELTDYIGGVKIVCTLQNPTTAKEIRDRISILRFKTDMQHLAWYKYDLLGNNMALLTPDQLVSGFVYVSVHPDAAYRTLNPDELTRFVENEKEKIATASSLETSLARVTQIDPSVGNQAKTRALIAIILSFIAIIAYIWIRFGTARYGVAAVVALVHDVCITLGAVTVCTYLAGKPLGNALLISDFKINLEMIAAFLTIIGYSLNDTIVVFDRIRENRGKLAELSPQVINSSINQTLSRTILTSFTTLLAVAVMYIWGGAGLRGFTFAMLIGIVVGTYSSIAIAAPILVLGKTFAAQKSSSGAAK